MPEEIVTGFERKTLNVVIQNWLYTEDMDTRIAAALEMRKRFLTYKAFAKPAWAKKPGEK